MSPDDISEGEYLSDLLEDEELDDIADDGTFWGLPPRPRMLPVSVESIKRGILSVYEKTKAAKTGTQCSCPSCGKLFVKVSYQQAFCCNKGRNNCKDAFWNRMNSERNERAKIFNRT